MTIFKFDLFYNYMYYEIFGTPYTIHNRCSHSCPTWCLFPLSWE